MVVDGVQLPTTRLMSETPILKYDSSFLTVKHITGCDIVWKDEGQDFFREVQCNLVVSLASIISLFNVGVSAAYEVYMCEFA